MTTQYFLVNGDKQVDIGTTYFDGNQKAMSWKVPLDYFLNFGKGVRSPTFVVDEKGAICTPMEFLGSVSWPLVPWTKSREFKNFPEE